MKSTRGLILVAVFGMILLLTGQVVLIFTFTEFSSPQYEIKSDMTSVINSPANSSPDTNTIEMRDPSGFFINSSYYNYGTYWSEWNYSDHIFRFDFGPSYQNIVNYTMWPLPFDHYSISEFTGNGTHFWILEWRNESQPALQFIYSFSLIDFQVKNHSLPILEEFHSGTRSLRRRDMVFWNNSLWVLEQWELETQDVNSDEIGIKSNITVYSAEDYQRIRSFEVTVGIWEICFDENGQLWESYPYKEDSLRQISKVNGSMINKIKGNFRDIFANIDPLLYSDYKHERSLPLIRNHSLFYYFYIGNGQFLSGFLFTPFMLTSFPFEAFLIWSSTMSLGIMCEIFVVIGVYRHFRRSRREKLD